MADSTERILSIQSHVVSGYVGNKSAAFPLQLLGFETDCINSVQFSNHTRYQKGWGGHCLEDHQLNDLIAGLEANGIDRYSHLINGYIGTPSFLKGLGKVVEKLRKVNPDLIYTCDPVMGDSEPVGLYVPESLLPIYRDEIVPMADVCVPNDFEAGLITGVDIRDEASTLEAIDKIHLLGPKVVAISSISYSKDDSMLTCLASSLSGGGGAEKSRFRLNFPRFPLDFVGSGDLFTALFTARLTREDFNVKSALEKTVASMQAVLKRTYDHYCEVKSNPKETQSGPDVAALRELKIIQSKSDIENPKIDYYAVPI